MAKWKGLQFVFIFLTTLIGNFSVPNTLDQHRAVNIGQPQPNDLARLSKIDVWPQIIGGQTVNDPKMFPWFARLITTGTCKYPKPEDKDKAGGCGGTLISKRLIATAFHCVEQKEVKNINGQDIIVDTEILCNPSTTDKDFFSGFVIVGTHIIVGTHSNDGIKINIKETSAPELHGKSWLSQHGTKREYGHDFAIVLLTSPVIENDRGTKSMDY